ncbi:DUF5682 family protein [Streptomyces sp. GQFP]|uniref:DUF5682 family protein n=1 Tax=Streptomyces sp. GQFP TaxID=2907545 RepID=UPI001F2EEB64|nr:DUF5682 family protein [Streptomyces sp. GQFP]UIX31353.1 DUF5682 family protein [Streptomyces sp. GQFP]
MTVVEGEDRGGRSGSGPLLLGVRHHGPGSARAVRAALAVARPAVVLIEGPPEADALIPLAADEDMRPPVALLAHAVDEPGCSAFWPLAEFSPEWVAVRWALEHGVPARFIDLPATHTLAWGSEEEKKEEEEKEKEGETREEGDGVGDPVSDTDSDVEVRVDPLAVLARAGGYDDPERWWEDVVEHRGVGEGGAFAPFEVLEEAMGALREVYGTGGHDRDPVREAYMRLQVRAAQREFGDAAVAVVCGAWHVPALRRKSAVAADRALLKGLPKVKVDVTWVPWTHRRLARASGYGAGIDSPGWYGHLFGARDRPVERWMTKVAGLLRDEDRMVSSAHVIEAVRLAETLAAMRGRPLPGLTETTDAVRAVMCEGSDVPLALVQDRLVVGDVLGEVPESAPAVPLQRDLTRLQRRLRLKPEALERELELDLRKETDAARSRLLHRLRLLGIGWGEPAASRGSTGTFRETWRLRWEPELAVRVAEAGVWGTTVLSAATARAEADAVGAGSLADVTALAERCLLAELSDALPVVMRVLADRAALDADVGHLAQALPALVRSLRYGDVRGTDTQALAEVAAGLAERVFVGLPPACAALDTDAADEMRRHVDAVHGAVGLLGEAAAPTPAPTPDTGTASAPGLSPTDGTAASGASGASGDGVPAGGVAEIPASIPESGESEEPEAPAGGSADADADRVAGAPVPGQRGELRRRGHDDGEAEDGLAGGDADVAASGDRREPGCRGDGVEAERGFTAGAAGVDADAAAEVAASGDRGELRSRGDGLEAEEGLVGGAVDARAGAAGDVPAPGHSSQLRQRWHSVLRVLSARDSVAGVVRGRAVRLLLDDGELGQDEAAVLMGLVLSPGTAPGDAAAWIEGFVGGGSGGGMLLVHDGRLLGLVDAWLTGVLAEAFTDVLPLLRRTFSAYEPGVRRTLGELVRRGPGERGSAVAGAAGVPGFAPDLDVRRADAVLPVLRLLLGAGELYDNDLVGVGT